MLCCRYHVLKDGNSLEKDGHGLSKDHFTTDADPKHRLEVVGLATRVEGLRMEFNQTAFDQTEFDQNLRDVFFFRCGMRGLSRGGS